MSGLDSYENIKEIDESLINDFQHIANEYKLNMIKYLQNGDMINVMLIFNGILARIPKDIFAPSCEGEKNWMTSQMTP